MKKVMVVDDAHADRINLEKIVAGAGHRVVSAVSGIQALQMARIERPDLIFIDVNLDGMDGFRVTRALQNDFATKGIPVVFVTARGQKADRVWARMLGAQGYLTKPYTDDQIHAQLHASLGSSCEAVH